MAQALHAFREYGEYHAESEKNWYRTSNTIAVLNAEDETHLMELRSGAVENGIKFAMFAEPDLGHSITAIAFEPGEKTSQFLVRLPRAGKTWQR